MKIRAISAELLGFEEDLDWTHPISVCIKFSDDTTIRFRCASDGQSIATDDQPLRDPVDMAECGRIEVHDLSDRPTIPFLTSDIQAVDQIIDENNVTVGVALMSDDGPILCFWNYGDELGYGSFASMADEHDWGARPKISGMALSLR
ncbi:hypothetical protein [Neorhizobium sp. DAR64861/K0K2]|uniref:hypothetical protein n=1 Tax=unclassified Neorhizobium TaxID=2629175 RepID=UPI003D2BD25E